MKTFFKILLVIVVISCSSDDSNAVSSSFSAKINGVDFQASTKEAILLNSNNSDRTLSVVAANLDNIISLQFKSNITTNTCVELGTYTEQDAYLFLDYFLNDGLNTVSEHSSIFDNGSTSLITVTSCANGKISGTFSATLYKQATLQNEIETPEIVEITEGKFENIKITYRND